MNTIWEQNRLNNPATDDLKKPPNKKLSPERKSVPGMVNLFVFFQMGLNGPEGFIADSVFYFAGIF